MCLIVIYIQIIKNVCCLVHTNKKKNEMITIRKFSRLCICTALLYLLIIIHKVMQYKNIHKKKGAFVPSISYPLKYIYKKNVQENLLETRRSAPDGAEGPYSFYYYTIKKPESCRKTSTEWKKLYSNIPETIKGVKKQYNEIDYSILWKEIENVVVNKNVSPLNDNNENYITYKLSSKLFQTDVSLKRKSLMSLPIINKSTSLCGGFSYMNTSVDFCNPICPFEWKKQAYLSILYDNSISNRKKKKLKKKIKERCTYRFLPSKIKSYSYPSKKMIYKKKRYIKKYFQKTMKYSKKTPIVCFQQTWGFGAEIFDSLPCFVNGILENRPVQMVTYNNPVWVDNEICTKQQGSFGTIGCWFNFITKSYSKLKVKRDNNDYPINIIESGEQKIKKDKFQSGDFESVTWSLAMILREMFEEIPNSIKKKINKYKVSRRDGGRYFNLNETYISLQIRAGDNCAGKSLCVHDEIAECGNDKFPTKRTLLNWANNTYFKWVRYMKSIYPNDIKSVYLSTDNQIIVDNCDLLINDKSIKCIYLDIDRTYLTNAWFYDNIHNYETQMVEDRTGIGEIEAKRIILHTLADLNILKRGSFFIGNTKSNFGRLAFLLLLGFKQHQFPFIMNSYETNDEKLFYFDKYFYLNTYG